VAQGFAGWKLLRRCGCTIDTWRWAEVPFYIRNGQMPTHFRDRSDRQSQGARPLAIFDCPAPAMPTNYYRLRLSPEVVIGAGAPW